MMRTCAVLALILPWAPAGAAVVGESWGGKGKAVTHPDTMKVAAAKEGTRLEFDLSAMPEAARVHRATLYCFTRGGAQPGKPVRLLAAGEPLKLAGPLYRSFDATEAVRARSKGRVTFAAAAFAGLEARRTCLEVCFEGKAKGARPQVTGLKAAHRSGQTFLTFQELPEFRPGEGKTVWIDRVGGQWQNCSVSPTGYNKAQTVLATEGGRSADGHPRVASIRLAEYLKLRKLRITNLPVAAKDRPKYAGTGPAREVRYRVYRHDAPVTAGNIHQARCVGEAHPLSIYHPRIDGRALAGDDPLQRNVVMTYRVGPDTPLLPGQALYVHTPSKPGGAYYAVTAVVDGTENLAQVGPANSLAEPVTEAPAEPKPVLQLVKPGTSWFGGAKTADFWHAYWPAPPYCNVPRQRPWLIGVAVGEKYKAPGPMDVTSSRGSQFGRILLTLANSVHVHVGREGTNRNSLGYNEGLGTLRAVSKCRVDYFIERYLASITRWARDEFKADPARVSSFNTGYFALRHPELFGLAIPGYLDRGVFTTWELHLDNRWNPDSIFLERDLGPAETARTVDGHRAWDVFSLEWYVRQYPRRDIPFFSCSHICGRDGGDGAEQGWQDVPRGLAALRDARQPFAAVWACGHEREWRNVMRQMRWDKSVPAFSNCSLDNRPGTGDADAGEPWGQINGYLLWEYDTVVDSPDRWEMTVYLIEAAPADRCTVDLTPRRRKAFHPKPGERLKWTNTTLKDSKVVGSGTAEADKWGLVTLRQIAVTKARNRIVIRKWPAARE